MPFTTWEIFPLAAENLESFKISEREQPSSYTGQWYVYRNGWTLVAGSALTPEEKLAWWNLYAKKKVDDYEQLERAAVSEFGLLDLTPFIGLPFVSMGDHIKSEQGMTYEETVSAMAALAPVLEGLLNQPSDPEYDYVGKSFIHHITHLERHMDLFLGQGEFVRFADPWVSVDVFTRVQMYIMNNLDEKPGNLDFDTIPELFENMDELVDALETMRVQSFGMGLGTLYDFHQYVANMFLDALKIYESQLTPLDLSVDDVYKFLRSSTIQPHGDRCCVGGVFFSIDNMPQMTVNEMAKIERELCDQLPTLEPGDVVSSLLEPSKTLNVEAKDGRLVSLSVGDTAYPRELVKREAPDVAAGSEAFRAPPQRPFPPLLTVVQTSHHNLTGTVVSWRYNQGRRLVCLSPGLPGQTDMVYSSTWVDNALIVLPEIFDVQDVTQQPSTVVIVEPQPYTGLTKFNNTQLAIGVVALFAVVYYLD